jgi:hypothetical protein
MSDPLHMDPRALILEAEATPSFEPLSEDAYNLLAVASQQDPASLEPPWVVRLSLRLGELLLARKELERAAVWADNARRHLGAEADHQEIEVMALEARLCAARGEVDEANRRLGEARVRLAGLPEAPAWVGGVLELALAELHYGQAIFAPIALLVEPLLTAPGRLARLDDLWRALWLAAHARQVRLELAEAAQHFRALLALCLEHGAPTQAADARLGLAQCLIGLGELGQGLELLQASLATAQGRDWHAAAALVTTATLSTGDIDGACAVAEAAATQAAHRDDYARYVQIVGVITALRRLQRRHKEAYKNLLNIYGILKNKFGDRAAAPILSQIEALRLDLGEEGFEALSAELLLEARRRG